MEKQEFSKREYQFSKPDSLVLSAERKSIETATKLEFIIKENFLYDIREMKAILYLDFVLFIYK